MYEERTYRDQMEAEGFIKSVVSVKESDLMILARRDLAEEARRLIAGVRTDLEDYIENDQEFETALTPHEPKAHAPAIVRDMARTTSRFGVGPMASVAGAVAQYVGENLSFTHGEVIIENGGDIYAHCKRPIIMSLYAGKKSPFTQNVRFKIDPKGKPIGICTSSGTVGHSLSQGKADAVCVIARDAITADAAATALCNTIQKKEDVDQAVKDASKWKGVKGVIAAMDDRLGFCGNVEIV